MTTVRYADVEVGTELRADVPGASQRPRPLRRSLRRLQPIHWSDRVARNVGLPGVIAHGMFTMAQAGRVITDWVGDPGAVVEYGVRFSAPVVVPDDDEGAELVVGGTVTKKLDDNQVVVTITARSAGAKVLARSTAVVRLP